MNMLLLLETRAIHLIAAICVPDLSLLVHRSTIYAQICASLSANASSKVQLSLTIVENLTFDGLSSSRLHCARHVPPGRTTCKQQLINYLCQAEPLQRPNISRFCKVNCKPETLLHYLMAHTCTRQNF